MKGRTSGQKKPVIPKGFFVEHIEEENEGEPDKRDLPVKWPLKRRCLIKLVCSCCYSFKWSTKKTDQTESVILLHMNRPILYLILSRFCTRSSSDERQHDEPFRRTTKGELCFCHGQCWQRHYVFRLSVRHVRSSVRPNRSCYHDIF